MNFGMCSFDMHKKNRLLRVRQEIGSNFWVVNCKTYLVNVAANGKHMRIVAFFGICQVTAKYTGCKIIIMLDVLMEKLPIRLKDSIAALLFSAELKPRGYYPVVFLESVR